MRLLSRGFFTWIYEEHQPYVLNKSRLSLIYVLRQRNQLFLQCARFGEAQTFLRETRQRKSFYLEDSSEQFSGDKISSFPRRCLLNSFCRIAFSEKLPTRTSQQQFHYSRLPRLHSWSESINVSIYSTLDVFNQSLKAPIIFMINETSLCFKPV